MTDALPEESLSRLHEQVIDEMRTMISQLPLESSGVREKRRLIEAVSRDQYWLSMDAAKHQVLNLELAPLMRYLPGVRIEEATFEIHCLEALVALLEGDEVARVRATASLRQDIVRLPTDHPDVLPHRDLVERHWNEDSFDALRVEDLLEIRQTLLPLMKHRLAEPPTVITLDLADAFEEQRWVEVGPEAVAVEIVEYRELVSAHVRELANTDPIIAAVKDARDLQPEDLETMARLLAAPDLYATEAALQTAWRAPHVSVLGIVRHILGLEPLVSREEAANAAIAGFIASRNYMVADQITFVRLIARRLLDAGAVSISDLYEHPFTAISTDPETLLPPGDLDEIMDLCRRYEVR